jgi:4'-phosphopantetheinyl transferase
VAALAVSESIQVGVDLEKIGDFDHLDISEHYFTPREHAAISGAGTQQATVFYRTWTLKEAILKAIGDGLSTSLRAFEISLAPPRLEISPEDWGACQNWSLRLSEPLGAYVCALAARSADVEVMERWYQPPAANRLNAVEVCFR